MNLPLDRDGARIMRTAGKKIAFVHIPRTGGTTLRAILNGLYLDEETISFYGEKGRSVVNESIRSFTKLDAHEKNAYNVLSGHFVFDFDPDLKDFHYITLLRDPVDRLVSYYFYALQDANHYLHSFLMQRRMRLEQFLLSDLSLEMDNYQVRAISGARFAAIRDRVTSEHACLAKRNLCEHFAAFGLLERFEESMCRFSRSLGWNMPTYERKNEGQYSKSYKLSDRCLSDLTERNCYDIELYSYAKTLFSQRDSRSITAIV